MPSGEAIQETDTKRLIISAQKSNLKMVARMLCARDIIKESLLEWSLANKTGDLSLSYTTANGPIE